MKIEEKFAPFISRCRRLSPLFQIRIPSSGAHSSDATSNDLDTMDPMQAYLSLNRPFHDSIGTWSPRIRSRISTTIKEMMELYHRITAAFKFIAAEGAVRLKYVNDCCH